MAAGLANCDKQQSMSSDNVNQSKHEDHSRRILCKATKPPIQISRNSFSIFLECAYGLRNLTEIEREFVNRKEMGVETPKLWGESCRAISLLLLTGPKRSCTHIYLYNAYIHADHRFF
jgi:hypothetical protein